MGLLGIGGQAAGAYFGGPAMAASGVARGAAQGATQGFNPYQRQYPTTMNMGNPYGSMNA
jgi:hypothetical protein